MSQVFWQAKIWGLLHDPALKGLHNNSGRGAEGAWESLLCMQGWVSPKAQSLQSASFCTKWLKHIALCDLISSASDRSAIGRLPTPIDYNQDGLEIRHLLSGTRLNLKLGQWHDFIIDAKSERGNTLKNMETAVIPDAIKQETDARKVFWWLWRCYPVALSRGLDRSQNIHEEPCLPLLPADTRIPDASVWSHTTMTSALAGALAGYYTDSSAYPKKYARENRDYYKSRPHVGIFTFSPVQELIKASRKMRDFWAGSWLLHYLSAKICWSIAYKYGPDTFLYPCLYEQPLIDLWLLETYNQAEFYNYIDQPSENRILTAGFPNVLVMILPDNGASLNPDQTSNPIKSVMQQAEQTLLDEWMSLGDRVLLYLQKQGQERWMPKLNIHTWHDWLKYQWQSYWTALPIGDIKTDLHCSPRQEEAYQVWQDQQNKFAAPQKGLLAESEANFLKTIYESALKEDWNDRHSSETKFKAKQANLNVGSWWASIFDRSRFLLACVKNARNWQIPTAFGPRSTISGLGPVVHPVYNPKKPDWATEGDTSKIWSERKNMGLFDGIEELNATEVIKRALHRILPDILYPKPEESNQEKLNKVKKQRQRLDLFYPDLTSGVAGWLKTMESQSNQKAIDYYLKVCQEISKKFDWIVSNNQPWGIPWIEKENKQWPNPRLLNAGWLIEDFEPENSDPNQIFTVKEKRKETQKQLKLLREFITEKFSEGNNPTDWYVIAAGDGDGMGDWLKGDKMKKYSEYIATNLKSNLASLPQEMADRFSEFINEQDKRMGPSTHSALSRALLDFSNQLVPYLTEQRYAGRLIYGGGDDVLAYTNLWEWDKWLWDIRQCFRGQNDGQKDRPAEFENDGDYWRWKDTQNVPKNLSTRPLFTMGSSATISFGIVIAHHSVPLAIALENMWEAEEDGAKEHSYYSSCSLIKSYCSLEDRKIYSRSEYNKKDTVQVRVIYGSGNILTATSKFDVFNSWQKLIVSIPDLEPSIFEQAATVWEQHPAPVYEAIEPWTIAFCKRREKLPEDNPKFQQDLTSFIQDLWNTTVPENLIDEIKNWLKLAAFILRKRDIKIPKKEVMESGEIQV